MQAAEHQTGMLGWTGDNGDPDNFLAELLGCNAEGKHNGNNIPKWCNAEVQEVALRERGVRLELEVRVIGEDAPMPL